MNIALDSSSKRHTDANGFLHVALSNISKETVNPYYGREIPGWESLGLDPEALYQGYREGVALEQSAPTFNGLPLLRGHHVEHAERPQTVHRVGSLGTDAVFSAPYLQNSLIVTDGEAIRKIESGERVELSAAYAYEPDFTAGTFEGQAYDFIMRDIRGNHVALVEEGRAGSDVVVADAKPKGMTMATKTKATRWDSVKASLKRVLAMDADPDIEKAETELEQSLLEVQAIEAEAEGLTPKEVGLDEDKEAAISHILGSLPSLDPAMVDTLRGELKNLAYATASGDADPAFATPPAGSPEPAKKDLASPAANFSAAMDACGLDAENPESQKAFAEGVKYGETKEKEERKKLASEHESEGAKAMDAAIIENRARKSAMTHMRALHQAAREVAPLVGEIDAFAFDSAGDIYAEACRLVGRTVSRAAARDVALALVDAKRGAPVAMDSTYKPRF